MFVLRYPASNVGQIQVTVLSRCGAQHPVSRPRCPPRAPLGSPDPRVRRPRPFRPTGHRHAALRASAVDGAHTFASAANLRSGRQAGSHQPQRRDGARCERAGHLRRGLRVRLGRGGALRAPGGRLACGRALGRIRRTSVGYGPEWPFGLYVGGVWGAVRTRTVPILVAGVDSTGGGSLVLGGRRVYSFLDSWFCPTT